VARADPATLTVARAGAEIACTGPNAWTVAVAGGSAEAVAFDADGWLDRWGDRIVRVAAADASAA
ncbi:hypothetical protein J8J27_28460, partial [Mycobacterium tuberculosis]|nr:hypothetical protein [Mycobacterium tuberculosis]